MNRLTMARYCGTLNIIPDTCKIFILILCWGLVVISGCNNKERTLLNLYFPDGYALRQIDGRNVDNSPLLTLDRGTHTLLFQTKDGNRSVVLEVAGGGEAYVELSPSYFSKSIRVQGE